MVVMILHLILKRLISEQDTVNPQRAKEVGRELPKFITVCEAYYVQVHIVKIT